MVVLVFMVAIMVVVFMVIVIVMVVMVIEYRIDQTNTFNAFTRFGAFTSNLITTSELCEAIFC